MAAITDQDAIANGWVIDFDEAGRKYYVAPDHSVFPAGADISQGPVANLSDSSSIGGSGARDWTTQVGELLRQGLSIYQLNQQQRAFNQANQVRLANGQAPLPWSDFAPTASVGVTADPRILWAIVGVGALVALGLFGGGALGGRRRR